MLRQLVNRQGTTILATLAIALPLLTVWTASWGDIGSTVLVLGAAACLIFWAIVMLALRSTIRARLVPLVTMLLALLACVPAVYCGREMFRWHVLASLGEYAQVVRMAEQELVSTRAERVRLAEPHPDLTFATGTRRERGLVVQLTFKSGSGRKALFFARDAALPKEDSRGCLTHLKDNWYWYLPCA